MYETVKLPKQWNHWCRQANLRPTHPNHQRGLWFNMKGRGRMWRVDCNGFLCCGDTYERFDRWALSDIITRVPMPKTEAEFLAVVNEMVELMNKYVPEREEW